MAWKELVILQGKIIISAISILSSAGTSVFHSVKQMVHTLQASWSSWDKQSHETQE